MSDRSKEIEKIIEFVKVNWAGLPSDQLFQQPAPGAWSKAEKLHHLIVSNGSYYKIFDEIISGKFKMNFWQRKSPFTKSIGQNMVRTLGPDVKQKFKSPKLFLPNSPKKIKPTIVSDFLADQEKLLVYLKELEKEKYAGLIISSPVSNLITLSLNDALDVIVVHEQRHVR